MSSKVNLTVKNRDYAVFTPAISGFYLAYISKQRYREFVENGRIPTKFENGIEGMNFLNKNEGYFTYKYGLYSAGHAELNLDKATEAESMVQERDRENTIIIGDSGGFQISKGVWQGNWLEPEGNCDKTDAQRQKVVNWLEHTADYSMVLDIPTNGLNFVDEKTGKPKCGLNNYEEFRDATIANNNYFMKHRQGKTKFLNVCQGSTYDQADDWFEKVCVPIVGDTHGWAFGGVQKTNLNHSVRRMLLLKDLGLLEGQNEWAHFLGTGRLDHAVIYTAMQRAIRKHVNPNFTISFDCASPFIAVANGQVYTHNVFTEKRFSYIMDKMVDDKNPMGKDDPWPWDDSPIGERLTWKDINWYDPGDLNKIGKEGRTSWDSFAYALMMGHNIYKHIDAVQMANRLLARPSDQMSSWMPPQYLEFRDLIDDLMSKDYDANIMYIDEELHKHEKLLAKLSRKKSLTQDTVFNQFFDNIGASEDDEFEEDINGKLEELENTVL